MASPFTICALSGGQSGWLPRAASAAARETGRRNQRNRGRPWRTTSDHISDSLRHSTAKSSCRRTPKATCPRLTTGFQSTCQHCEPPATAGQVDRLIRFACLLGRDYYKKADTSPTPVFLTTLKQGQEMGTGDHVTRPFYIPYFSPSSLRFASALIKTSPRVAAS